MQERLNIAVFVDYDNIEIGVKSTLRREFNVAATLDALRERGDIVAKFAYANWSRHEHATQQMAENAVQMVQRNPSPRGDKNGGDINLALDALEMAFTHDHVNAFAIISGDSDFIPLVNKLREFGKTIFVVGGKAFTSTILQKNCHEFISYESLIGDSQKEPAKAPPTKAQPEQKSQPASDQKSQTSPDQKSQPTPQQRPPKRQAKTLDPAQALPLIERALQALERRGVQPQLGLMKSTMLQLDSRFSEKAYGASSFSEFVDKLKEAGFVNVSGTGGQATIVSKTSSKPERALIEPEDALPLLRDVLETHRMDLEEGCVAEELEAWMAEETPGFDLQAYGFTEFAELLNFAQDKLVVRVEPDEEEGLRVFLGPEFYPSVTLEQNRQLAAKADERRPPNPRRNRRPRKHPLHA